MELFDCNCWYGISPTPPLRFPETVNELLEEMKFCGVNEALVFNVAEREDTPLVGNRLTVEGTKGREVLHPVWSILPSQTGEQESPDEFVGKMKESGVKVLRAFPSQQKFLLNRNTFGPLFKIMESRKVPLILDAEWDQITNLLRDFPSLVVVAIACTPWGQDRYFRPLIEKYSNFYVDTSRYELDGGIKDFCKSYGSERMLFGSGYPEFNMGGAVVTLSHADIPDEDKINIASKNLKRLLAEVRL